jgi:hypothetical protein
MEDWHWLDLAWNQAVDSMMPVNTNSLVTFRSRAGILSYAPDSQATDLERYFDIREILPGGLPPWTLVATVVAPLGRSFQEQLMTLHLDSPNAAPKKVQLDLSVLRSEITENECPELRVCIKKLAKVRVHVPRLNAIALDAGEKEIHVRTGMGEIDAHLVDNKEPLVRWAVETFDILRKCAIATRGPVTIPSDSSGQPIRTPPETEGLPATSMSIDE